MATLTIPQQVRNALQSPMAAAGEMGYEPVFSDNAIFVSVYDAVNHFNFEFLTTLTPDLTLDDDGLATAIDISPEPNASQSILIAQQAALLLFEEWCRVNLFDGEIGVVVRDGLGSISTMGRSTHVTKSLERMSENMRRMISRYRIRLAGVTSAGRNTGEE